MTLVRPPASALLALCALLPAATATAQGAAAADRAIEAEEPAEGYAAGAAEAERTTGARARIVVPPPTPPPGLTSAMLEDALRAARPAMEACAGAGGRPRGTVRARVSRDGALTLRVRLRPADDDVERCVDTAARRHLVPLLTSRAITRAVSATIRLGGGTPAPPPPPPPPPPPGPVDEAIVHQRLDTATSALMRCLADAAPGVVGTVTLRVHARADGGLVLEGVTMPPGVTAGPALVCMGSVVSMIRVPPGGGDRDVSHPIALGR